MMTRRQKKFCSLLAAIALLFGMLPTLSASAASMPSGSGTERDPYILTNASELAFMEDLPDAYYKLAADINLTDSWDYIEAKFTGVLDGDGYTIRMSPNPGKYYAGLLFYWNSGTIKNLSLEGNLSYSSDLNIDIDCSLLTQVNEGTIENCSARGSLSGHKQRQRGTWTSPLMGSFAQTNYGTIRNCYSTVDISYTFDATGEGEASPSDYVWNCGGIAGKNEKGRGKIENCYFAGSLPRYGAPIAVESSVVAKASGISNCYYDKEVAGRDSGGGTPKSTLAMKLQAAYSGWDFNSVWYMDPSLNDGYPVLRNERRFSIPAGAASASGSSAAQTSGHTVTTAEGIGITFGDRESTAAPTTTPASTSTSTSTPASTTTPVSTLPPNNTGNIRVYVNGVQLSFDQPPVVVNQRTMVPVRAIFEALGADVEWNDPVIVSTRGDVEIAMMLGETIMTKDSPNGSDMITLDTPPRTLNNRTLVPVRAISEAFDCNVQWDGATQSVIITD